MRNAGTLTLPVGDERQHWSMTTRATAVPRNSKAFRTSSNLSWRERFREAAHHMTLFGGSWQFFLGSVLAIVIWAAIGPVMQFTDTWQLLVNTPTTVLTFLLGILILMEANRQAKESR